MNGHDCDELLGLAGCIDHPRWNVTKSRIASFGLWWAWAPGRGSIADKSFRTHAEAIAYATEQARAQMVAAVQDGAA